VLSIVVRQSTQMDAFISPVRNSDDVIIMFSIVGLYDSKRLIELDATLMKYDHVIRASFIRSKTY